MTEERKPDRPSLYRPGHQAEHHQKGDLLWWPTNVAASRCHGADATNNEVEAAHLTVYVSVGMYAWMMLFQVGWYETTALVVWSVICSASFAAAYLGSALTSSTAPLAWWTCFMGPLFGCANYLACGCTPFASSGGRFAIAPLFSVAFAARNGVPSVPSTALAVVEAALFIVLGALEGSGVTCFDTHRSEVSVVAQVFCQLVFPTVLLTFAAIQQHRRKHLDEEKFACSEAFARECIRQALAGDIDALGRAVAEFDSSSTVLPSMGDDALSVVIDLLQKTAKAVEEAKSRRPASRSPSQSGLLAVPAAANNSASSGDDEAAAPGKRRRSSRLMSLEAATAPLLPPFPVPEKGLLMIAAFSLPNLRAYVNHPNCNVDHAALFLNEFADNCRTATSRYGGTICFASFETVYARFPHAAPAVGAALCVSELTNRSRRHHVDAAVLDTKVLYPTSVVLQTHAMFGSFGTQCVAGTLTIGFAEAETLYSSVLQLKREGTFDKSAEVFVPVSMQKGLSDVFSLKPTPQAELLAVTAGCKLDAEGFAVVPPSGDTVTAHVSTYDLPKLAGLRHADTVSSASQSFGSIAMAHSETVPPLPQESSKRSSRVSVHNKDLLPPEAVIAWEKYDADGSGTLDVEECRAIFEDLGYRMTEEDFQQFFRDVDKDGSGTISKQEFAAAFANPNVGGAAVMDKIVKAGMVIAKTRGGDAVAAVLEAWQKYDKDNSGTLDYNEIAALLVDLGMAQSQVELDWLVKKLDRDNSGYVDFEEFSRLFSNDSVSRQVAAKARGQVVTRVVNNKNSGVIFSNADQLLRDDRVHLASLAERFVTLPLFMYIAYNCGSITFDIALGETRSPSTTKLIVDMVLDSFLVGWVLVKYLFLPREDKGQIAFHRKDVLMHSLRTVDFYVDLLAVLPIDFVYIGLGVPLNNEVVGYYRINKLLLYWYLDDCYKNITKTFNPAIVRAANAMLYFMTFAHLFACFLIGLVRVLGETGTGVVDLIGFDRILSDSTRTYPVGLYWAIITLVGQNRGTILPELDQELILLIVAMFVGLPMYAVVLGTIGQAVRVDDSYTKFLDKIDNLRSYFQYTRLPEHIENECVAYYRHLYFTTGSLDITENPLEDLPAELSIQVVIQIGQEMLRKVPIFQDASKNAEFVHELTTKLVPEVIPPLTTVMKKGERGSNMYFISFGDFNILADNGMVVFTLKKGNFFGEIALLHNVKRTATIQSFNKFSNVLSLDKKDFDEVTATFPDCLSQVYKAAEDRIKQILEREAEEAKLAKEKRKAEREALRKAQAENNGGADLSEKQPDSSSDDETLTSSRRTSGAVTLDLSKSKTRFDSAARGRNRSLANQSGPETPKGTSTSSDPFKNSSRKGSAK